MIAEPFGQPSRCYNDACERGTETLAEQSHDISARIRAKRTWRDGAAAWLVVLVAFFALRALWRM